MPRSLTTTTTQILLFLSNLNYPPNLLRRRVLYHQKNKPLHTTNSKHEHTTCKPSLVFTPPRLHQPPKQSIFTPTRPSIIRTLRLFPFSHLTKMRRGILTASSPPNPSHHYQQRQNSEDTNTTATTTSSAILPHFLTPPSL